VSNDPTGGDTDPGKESDGPVTSDPAGPDDQRRRRLIVYGGIAALGATGVAGAWFGARNDDPPTAPTDTPTATATNSPTPTETDADTETPDPAVPAVVRRHAPDLYFGRLEKWFPTDPREYLPGDAADADDPVPLEGEPALEGYSADMRASGRPPHPTVFYNCIEVSADVEVVQYWMYSAFDQFTVNFHWHDWELLQVFVDSDTGDPMVVSASAHSRKVPNNEVRAPDVPGGRRIGILSEVGSHSSATDVNDSVPSFERRPTGVSTADVTNGLLGTAAGTRVPFAYGLPRDEGARLPFVMPELDGHRLDRHPDLDLRRSDFVDESVTVTDWKGLPTPPDSIPFRKPGLVMTHPESPTTGDVTYALDPLEDVRAEISAFVGPQLSFQFRIPGYVEDQVAGHITDVGIPWEQPRFDDPLADVTDPGHRAALEGQRPASLSARVTGTVRRLRTGGDGTVDRLTDPAANALSDRIPVSFSPPPTELAVQLSSPDPVASATNGGRFGFLHVEPGDHRLVVNGPGYAPVAERFAHDGGLVRAGAGGDLGVVAATDAVRVRADGRDSTGIRRVIVVEDYAGTVYDGRPPQTDRVAVPVHRDGSYTVTVVDRTGRRGQYRFTPDDLDENGEYPPVERTETGKLSLLRALRDSLQDLRDLAGALRETDDAQTPERDAVRRRLFRAIESVEAAIADAEEGVADAANEHVTATIGHLEDAEDAVLAASSDTYGDAAVTVLVRRIRTAIGRAETARTTELAGR